MSIWRFSLWGRCGNMMTMDHDIGISSRDNVPTDWVDQPRSHHDHFDGMFSMEKTWTTEHVGLWSNKHGSLSNSSLEKYGSWGGNGFSWENPGLLTGYGVSTLVFGAIFIERRRKSSWLRTCFNQQIVVGRVIVVGSNVHLSLSVSLALKYKIRHI